MQRGRPICGNIALRAGEAGAFGERPVRMLCLTMGLAILMGAPLARAESSTEAIRAFGLVGTWSPDCSRDPTKPDMRTTYAAPELGAPTVILVFSTASGASAMTVMTKSEIKSAARIAEEKIQIVSVRVGAAMATGPFQSSTDSFPVEYVIQKFGDKRRTIDSHSLDGKRILIKDGFQYAPAGPSGEWHKTDRTTPLLEKCGD
jgi:hypothetical protein